MAGQGKDVDLWQRIKDLDKSDLRILFEYLGAHRAAAMLAQTANPVTKPGPHPD